MYNTRHQNVQNFYVLTTSKKVDGEPLNGKFYRLLWKDGETVTPQSYRDAIRVARIYGCQLVNWTESKEYKRLLGDIPKVEDFPEPPKELVESKGNTFTKISKKKKTLKK